GRAVRTVAVAPDGKTAVTGSADGTARLWELATGKPLRVLRPPTAETALITCGRYTPDGKVLAVGDFSGVSVWDAAAGKLLRDLPGGGRIVSLGFSPDGGRLVWQGIDDEDLHLWDARSGKSIRRLRQGTGGCYFLAYSPREERIASVVTGRLS